MKIGDKVKITDGSYAVRIDEYHRVTSIGMCRDDFEIVFVENPKLTCWGGSAAHDIHIKNLKTGAIYLHSSCMVKKVGRRRVLNQVRLMQVLTAEGYIPIGGGFGKYEELGLYFDNSMWKYCEKEIDETLRLGYFLFKESWTEEY